MERPDLHTSIWAGSLAARTGDVGYLWHDASARHAALEAIVIAWEQGDSVGLTLALARVDRAVTAGLAACSLPRPPVRDLRCEAFSAGGQGRKRPTCELWLNGPLIERALRFFHAPDDIWRTWVHESIHGRAAFAPTWRQEWELVAGYEEGLAEGLARSLLRAQPGMAAIEHSFEGYVVAYATLADVLAVPATALWRRLWEEPPGTVRSGFMAAIDDLAGGGTSSHGAAGRRILLTADGLFRTNQRARTMIDRAQLRRMWEEAVR